jgi:hypothetical protein
MSLVPDPPPLLRCCMAISKSTDQRLRVSAVQSVQERDHFPFGNISPELQQYFLLNSAWHLDDAARAAVASKQLRGLYHERCAADEEWLESAAIAVFGEQFVELVLSWVASPPDEVPAFSHGPQMTGR